jgi:hypothetical protein
MTKEELLVNYKYLQSQYDFTKIEHDIIKPEFNHPLLYHIVVEKFIQANNKEKAMFYASQSSEFVNNDHGSYFDTVFGNSLGTMISFPLIRWEINSFNRTTIFKVLANAYIYLSNGINLFGLNAYDSIRTRGILIQNYSGSFENLANEYHIPYYYVKEVTQAMIHDKMLTNKAFQNIDMNQSNIALSDAKELTIWYNTNFQSESSIEEIEAEGKSFHGSLYDALIQKFLDGEFHFTKEEYLNLIKQ